MSRKVIANWKMHFSLKEAVEFCSSLSSNLSSDLNRERRIEQDYTKLIIAAPAPYLAHLAYLFPHLNFAAQDVSKHEHHGAYTGEFSASQLASCGIRYCIIGHPERRCNFGESDDIIKLKADSCLAAGVIPIICLATNLSFDREFDSKYMIAYEPEESIGTGLLPDDGKLIEVFGLLKSMFAKSVNLIYGGSVNSTNLSRIKAIDSIDSVLLGGASLNIDNLKKILKDW